MSRQKKKTVKRVDNVSGLCYTVYGWVAEVWMLDFKYAIFHDALPSSLFFATALDVRLADLGQQDVENNFHLIPFIIRRD